MMKDRPINIEKLEKLCSSHLTKTKIIIKNEYYEITISNGINTCVKLEKISETSYKKMLNIILKLKKETKHENFRKI